MRRILITSRNDRFPSLGDGYVSAPADRAVAGALHPVHSQDTPTVECSAAPAAAPVLQNGGGRRAPLHLASLADVELAQLVRTDEAATARELELATRIFNLLDELEAATNAYNGDD